MTIDYDIETFRAVFTAVFRVRGNGMRWVFEVSRRVNQSELFSNFLWSLKKRGDIELCGYNNEFFDWPICQYLMGRGSFTAEDAYFKAQEIISSKDRFAHVIWPDQRHIKQVDLFKMQHFDNFARSTSLKALEINMRMDHVEDLPFSPHVEHLTDNQIDEVIVYNCHDVDATAKFGEETIDDYRFRLDLAIEHGVDMMNFNDTKIGKDYFIRELEDDTHGICFDKQQHRKTPRQTWRSSIAFKDIIFPYVEFKSLELSRVLDWFKSTTITETKGAITDVSATLGDFTFHFGTGGIHGSVTSETFHADDEYEIVDVDVTSYYPSLAIANRVFPEHLSEKFCDIYERLFEMRKKHPKGSTGNKMFKLALNGVYGDSNNKYSPFYDPQYTMTITVNGQLLLCMLAERILHRLDDVKLIQINTDGLTVRIPRGMRSDLTAVCYQWEGLTGLNLESADYASMWVRDVNNYVALYTDGKVKRKGAFEYKKQWHQDQSDVVITKAVEAALLHGTSPVDFIYEHDDHFDFCRRAKVPRSSRLEWGGEVIQNTTRYHIATGAPELVKIMPGLRDGPERRISIDKGWGVQVCNDISHFDWTTLDRRFYIDKAHDLIRSVGL